MIQIASCEPAFTNSHDHETSSLCETFNVENRQLNLPEICEALAVHGQ